MPQALEMTPEQAIDKLRGLPEERQRSILAKLPKEKKRQIIIDLGHAMTAPNAGLAPPPGPRTPEMTTNAATGEGSIAKNLTSFEAQGVNNVVGLGKMIKKSWMDKESGDQPTVADQLLDPRNLNPVVRTGGGVDIGATLANVAPFLFDLEEGESAAHSPVAKVVRGGTRSLRRAVTEDFPKHEITQEIRPTAADVKFGKDPARAVLNENIVGNSLPDLGTKVFDRLHEIGNTIDQTLQSPENATKKLDASKALEPVDRAMKQAVKDGDQGLYERLAQLKQQFGQEWKEVTPETGGKGTIQPTGPRDLNLNPYEATQLKRLVGDSTTWTGNDPFENKLNAVKGDMYAILKNEVNEAVPAVKDLNERYSNLVSAGKAIERRIPVSERLASWHLSDIALGASGHLPLAATRKLLGTTAIRTRIAQGLHGFSEGAIERPASNLPSAFDTGKAIGQGAAKLAETGKKILKGEEGSLTIPGTGGGADLDARLKGVNATINAEVDTSAVDQARSELGQNAKLSDVMRRAQEIKLDKGASQGGSEHRPGRPVLKESAEAKERAEYEKVSKKEDPYLRRQLQSLEARLEHAP